MSLEGKRQDPCFWLENRCTTCGHSAPSVYKPDLLEGPIDFQCQSRFNPMRRFSPCSAEWSVAIDPSEVGHLKGLLNVAEEQDELRRRVAINRNMLGYTD